MSRGALASPFRVERGIKCLTAKSLGLKLESLIMSLPPMTLRPSMRTELEALWSTSGWLNLAFMSKLSELMAVLSENTRSISLYRLINFLPWLTIWRKLLRICARMLSSRPQRMRKKPNRHQQRRIRRCRINRWPQRSSIQISLDRRVGCGPTVRTRNPVEGQAAAMQVAQVEATV